MTPNEYIKRLIEVSDKKHKLLQNMLILTKQQSQSINEDGLEQLDKIIEDKQNLINQIDKLDEEFNVYFLRLKQVTGIKSLEELKGSDTEGIKLLQEAVGRVMQLLRDIDELEKRNNISAKTLLDGLGSEIRKINQAKQVNRAYNSGPVMQPPSYFIDKKK